MFRHVPRVARVLGAHAAPLTLALALAACSVQDRTLDPTYHEGAGGVGASTTTTTGAGGATSTGPGGHGQGGATTTSSTGSGAGGHGGAAACDPPCAAPKVPECEPVTCTSGACASHFAPDGTELAQQTAGDCKVVVCDGEGGTREDVAPTDSDDGNGCTDDACDQAGVVSHTPTKAGAACAQAGGAVCDGEGACVECVTEADCKDPANPACLGGHQCGPGVCANKTKDGDETDVDCGGGTCGPCATGKKCLQGEDCLDHLCTGSPGTCAAPTCTDGVKNGDETDVDCGGVCDASSPPRRCGPTKGCKVDADCAGNQCDGVACVPNCADGTKTGNETDVDCGGACASGNPKKACAEGQGCAAGADCQSGGCCKPAGTCSACCNGATDGTETDVDCGGSCPTKCSDGGKCKVAADCLSGLCGSGTCQPGTCSDNAKDGAETDVDCGGPACSKCVNGKKCGGAGDCASGFCVDGVCCEGSCTTACFACNLQGKAGVCAAIAPGSPDAYPQNACGGASLCDGAGKCKATQGQACASGGACLSGFCSDGVCCDSACDGLCTSCVASEKVSGADGVCGEVKAGTDPQSECLGADVCAAGAKCRCADGVKDGAETDVDCGGGTCGPCAQGKACAVGGECTTGSCVDGVCCEGACGAACKACSAAKKGSGIDGVCGAIKAGTDPDAECAGADMCSGSAGCQCADGVKDGSESDVDCGGACSKCAQGKACGAGSDCATGHCIDGVCCDTGCSTSCVACTASRKGSGVDGTCGNIKAGTDPDAECAGSDSCSGSGVCQCANGVKDNGEADVDCGGVCAKCGLGKACGAAGDCSSGFCVDGVCCNSVCTATCMACSATLTGQASGTCANIQVQGVDTYPANTCVAPSFCSGTGSCGVCVPGALRCSGNVAQACNYTGAWVAQQTCGGGNVCRAGACVAQGSCAGLAATCGSGANQSCCLTKQVTGGAFYMGQPQGGANLGPNDDYTGYYKDNTEGPEHNASVNTFKLDAFETTVGRFRKFVAAYPWTPGAGEGAVLELGGVGWQAAWNSRLQASQAALTARLKSCQGATWTDAVGGNENQPINCVDYYTAYAFCIWDGGRLPTEAEWEYASTAGLADRMMPWGAGIPAPDCTYSNSWNSCQGGAGVPHNVGLATNGVSAYGHHDMVGNVWEIAYDQKAAYAGFDCALGSCIAAPPASNVAFSAVLKGSAYDNETVEGRSARRGAVTSTAVYANVGFRCMHYN